MTAHLLATPVRHWECPNCAFTDTTRRAGPHTQMHPCTGLAGLLAPMIPAGTRARVHTVEREDYIGDEVVRLDDNGRPVAFAVVTRPDGSNDVVAYAPAATARGVA